MGKSTAPQYTTLSDLVPKIQDIVHVYRDAVLGAIAESIDEGAKVYVREVKKVSPPDDGPGIGGHYRSKWKIKPMRKARFVKYIGNTKKVKAHVKDKEPTIPLINILEFSTRCGKPHVGKALENSSGEIIDLVIEHIKKEGN